jgi:hypothetical protein
MPGPSPGGRHASGGSEPSAVPQPSSAGCAASPRNPSTDQVETNSPAALGVRLTWLSCSEIWMVRIPSSRNRLAQPAADVGACRGSSTALASSSAAALRSYDTSPGLAPWQITAVGLP